ncbi:unnamed protein product [Pleuronectes platessa]|uniref:Uncharacterized protein n=1 Tax=Pleuronectes platessa TaxID=8262 RepID=A0A9N7UWK8_PLEPL|nr:unnamed protein product [Pleuronectes platessa]
MRVEVGVGDGRRGVGATGKCGSSLRSGMWLRCHRLCGERWQTNWPPRSFNDREACCEPLRTGVCDRRSRRAAPLTAPALSSSTPAPFPHPLRAAPHLTPGSAAGQSGCTSGSLGPNHREPPAPLRLETLLPRSFLFGCVIRTRGPGRTQKQVPYQGVVHGNVHMLPSGTRHFIFNITPLLYWPLVSLCEPGYGPAQRWYVARRSQMPLLKRPVKGSGAEGLGARSALN